MSYKVGDVLSCVWFSDKFQVMKIDESFYYLQRVDSSLKSLEVMLKDDLEKSNFQLDKPTLKPCPFCGGSATVKGYNYEFFIGCEQDNCQMRLGSREYYETDSLAKLRWNKRA